MHFGTPLTASFVLIARSEMRSTLVYYDEFEGYFKVHFPVPVSRCGAIALGRERTNSLLFVLYTVPVAAFLNMLLFVFELEY